MDKPLSLLLVEDEPAECAAFVQHIDTIEDVCLVQVTNNADKALEYVKAYLPDAVILDLELHKGGGNGVSFLMALQEEPLPFSPYILVTTNNVSSVTHKQVRRSGADFVMVKSQQDYSTESVVGFLRVLKDTIQDSRRRKHNPGELDHLPPAEARKRLLARLNVEMDLVGISPKATGRKYLIDAITLLAGNPNVDFKLELARKYGKTEASVERAMQNAIQRAWTVNDIEELQKYYTGRFNAERGAPTLGEFLYHYADKYRKEQ